MRGQGQAGVEIYIESNEHVKKLKYVIVPSRIRFTSESHPLKQAVLKLSLCKVENFFPIVLEGVSGFLKIAIINFTSRLLFDLLFTCRLKDFVSPVIFHSRF